MIETRRNTTVKTSIVAASRMNSSVGKMDLWVSAGWKKKEVRYKLTTLFDQKDLTDMLKEEIKGPASFNCVGPKCTFSEPAMDDLISAIFGDDSIYLNCNSGECLHYTMVPGFDVRIKGRKKKKEALTRLSF